MIRAALPWTLALAVAGALAGCGDASPAPPVPDAAPEAAAAPGPRRADGPVLLVDADGFFVSERPVEGAWYGGEGVPCLLPIDGATDGEILVGRIAASVPDPLLWSRSDDGPFDAHRPLVRASAESLRGRLREAYGASLEGAEPNLLSEDLAPPAPDPASAPPRRPDVHTADVLAPGTPLLARVPPNAIVAHVRSVEAGYRFAGIADELAGALAPPLRARRDVGTLRMALHDLLLPTIWRANPGGVKGVSECAVALFPPLREGRPDAAVLFRIVDPEEHAMDTVAGVAIEARPEHLWRPAGDPYPNERVRRNARTVAGDMELVAAGASVLARVGGGLQRRVEDSTPEAIAARWGLPPSPGPSRALVLEIPEAPGLSGPRVRQPVRRRALLERWTGLRAVPPGLATGGDAPADDPWARVRAASVDTDAKGASIAVRLDDDRAATALVAILEREPAGPAEVATACAENLADLVLLGRVEPRASDVAERAFVWLGWRPVCAAGGTYRFHPITGEPTCSEHGSRATPREGGGAPPAPISEVARDGSLVTFRLAIVWSRRQ